MAKENGVSLPIHSRPPTQVARAPKWMKMVKQVEFVLEEGLHWQPMCQGRGGRSGDLEGRGQWSGQPNVGEVGRHHGQKEVVNAKRNELKED